MTTFKVGDRVVAVEDNDILGLKKGVVYTVTNAWVSATGNPGQTVMVKSASGEYVGGRSAWFKQYEPSVPFELQSGDKIRNRITGREGYVYMAPILRQLKVYDARPPYRDGVLATLVEDYEEQFPGTYEIVSRKTAVPF